MTTSSWRLRKATKNSIAFRKTVFGSLCLAQAFATGCRTSQARRPATPARGTIAETISPEKEAKMFHERAVESFRNKDLDNAFKYSTQCLDAVGRVSKDNSWTWEWEPWEIMAAKGDYYQTRGQIAEAAGLSHEAAEAFRLSAREFESARTTLARTFPRLFGPSGRQSLTVDSSGRVVTPHARVSGVPMELFQQADDSLVSEMEVLETKERSAKAKADAFRDGQ